MADASQQAALDDHRWTRTDADADTGRDTDPGRERRQPLGESPYCRQPTPDPDRDQLPHPEDHCQGCGNPQVLPKTRQGFGDNQDVLWRCFACATFRELQDGAGARSDRPGRYERRGRTDNRIQTRADGGNHQ